jgi:hypothetical protein
VSETTAEERRVTIRMRRCPEQTLWDYIFTDLAHARSWLKANDYKPADVKLERVEVGPLLPCRCCKGAAWSQSVKKVGDVALEDLLS